MRSRCSSELAAPADGAGLAEPAGRSGGGCRPSSTAACCSLWTESYARALVEPDGPWAGFATATVEDWLRCWPTPSRRPSVATAAGEVRRTLVLAVLRGALLDLLATGDVARTTRAVTEALRSV